MDKVWETLLAIIVSCTGGLANIFNQKDKKALRLLRLVSHVFVSGFTGLMVLFALRILSIEGDYVGLLCGLAGWTAPTMLDGLGKFGTKVGIDVPPAESDTETKK